MSTLFLVVAGASVTSNQAGLSVPDWPLSYGQVMPEMKGGVFYEHGHRMIASAVDFSRLFSRFGCGASEERKWLQRLRFVAVGAVILQGVLGGITVLLSCSRRPSVSVTPALRSFSFPPPWRWHYLPRRLGSKVRSSLKTAALPSLRSLTIFASRH